MAKIKTLVANDITVRKIIGVATAEEILEAVREFYAGQITKNVIWDVSSGSLADLTSKDVRNIMELVRVYSHTRTGGKTAIVAPADLEYGIARMLSILGELIRIPIETETFRTLSDAAKWMGVDDPPTIDDEG